MSMTDAEIREALARAERATGGECIVRNRYSHGGGRMYREDGPARDLILDVYDEANREFYFAARTDVPRLAADLLAARAERDEFQKRLVDVEVGKETIDAVNRAETAERERDEARASLSTPTLAKRQPCGCVVCTCGDVERCGGCGARMCDRHRDDRPSLANDPATVWEAHPLLARAETAEARCRELEAERAIVADYLRDTDADFRARRPSERAVLDALLSPPPPHTCQIHRATSGASDCGLSPCEEAKVHRDRGAARPATPDPRDAEIAALRGRVAALEADAKIGRVVREFDAEARDILGRPCFTCGRIAEVLRRMGRTIPPKAEDEQAEVLRWMLGLYAEHGAQWREKGDEELRAALAATEVPRG